MTTMMRGWFRVLAAVLAASLIRFTVLASETAVSGLPAPNWPDAEVSTNAVLGVSVADLAELRVRIALTAEPTNSVWVAVGDDVDGDGTLSPSEEGVAVGCDCGMWFLRRSDGSVEEFGDATFGRVEREFAFPVRGSVRGWSRVRVVRNGCVETGEAVTVGGIRRSLRIIVR